MVADLQGEADQALRGDGTCTRDNMETSCFAAEDCASLGYTCSSLRNILAQKHRYVATWSESTSESTSVFLGCVGAQPCSGTPSMLFPNLPFHADDLCIFSLCVAHSHRKTRGICRKLINTVLSISQRNTYLLVALGPSLVKRSDNLRCMYKHLQFREVCEDCKYLLMRHAPSG